MNDGPEFEDNDQPLPLDDRQSIAINWTDEGFEKIYDQTKETVVVLHNTATAKEEEEDNITLDECVNLFTTTEKLGPEDPWYCSQCKDFRQATKKFDLWKLPKIVVVHLKRFSYKNRYFREKLETLVDYPIKGLDFSKHIQGPCDQSPVYDLFAVSNHYGSLGGGHYTAYAKNKNTNKWYKFDDSSVSEIEEERVKTSAAYVLFYQRRDTRIITPPTEEKKEEAAGNTAPTGEDDEDSAGEGTAEPMETKGSDSE